MICFYSTKRFVCGINIFMPIGEELVIIYGVVPLILIYLSSICDLLPYSLIFLEEYDELLNDLFCCCYSCTSLNIIVLIINNERKKEMMT